MPEFSFKEIPNWSKLRQRYSSLWARKVPDNKIIAHIQNRNPNQPAPEPWMKDGGEKKYLDPVKLFEFKTWTRKSWNWHDDLFKYRIASYAPSIFSGFCGAKPAFGKDTVWFEPIISSLDEADKAFFDKDRPIWKNHLETVGYFSEKCRGQELLGMTDFGGPTDWISQLMGTENFLIATIEEPERMRDFAIRLANESLTASDIIYPLVAKHDDGMVNWMPVWGGIQLGTVQDDMAINISPEMYEEVFLPALRILSAHTEQTVLHWHDGCAHLLDSVLKIEDIDMIQFGHDPNSASFRDSVHHMRKIQAAGKLLFISCVESEDTEFFIDNLDPAGLMMIINTSDDEASRKMCDNVRKWTSRQMGLE